MTQVAAGAPLAGTGHGYGSPGYRNYVLLMLTFVYTLNFIDRILIGVVAEPIIKEFALSDTQFSLLSGPGFAIFYTLAGIPIARLAERYNRVRLIAISVIVWSVMTALCGVANGFIALLAFRIGVGIGEAGCTPPANSIIADYFPPRKRARALAIFALGVTLGGLLANLFGGPIAKYLSWRDAFLLLGLPGIIVGIVVWMSIKEPPRGFSEEGVAVKAEAPGLGETMKSLMGNRTFWFNTAAATIVAFVGYGVNAFQSPFFIRVYGLDVGYVAIWIAVPLALCAAFGTFFFGFATERLSPRYNNVVAWLPAVGLLIAVLFYVMAFNAHSLALAFPLMAIAAFCHYGYLGAQYTICQAVVDVRSRATALAIMLFIINLIGYGLGPPTIGILSDWFAQGHIAASGFANELTLTACKGADALKLLGEAKAAVCAEATGQGLRSSMSTVILLFGLAALCFFAASRTLGRDLVSKLH